MADPALRDWGVIIGGSTPKPVKPDSCAEPFEWVDDLRERLEEEGKEDMLGLPARIVGSMWHGATQTIERAMSEFDKVVSSELDL